jgi:HAD superfamily hydrolase (TIGR01509 family)
MSFALAPAQIKAQMYGKNPEVFQRLLGADAARFDLDWWSRHKEAKYREVYRGKVRPLPGLPELMQKAAAHGIVFGIGSAAPDDNIQLVLNELGWDTRFKAIVSADQTTKGKPDPEVFVKVATRLGAAPGTCLVFEDSPKGAEAAARAGMACAVLLTTHTAAEFGHLPNIVAMGGDYTGWVVG